MKKRKGRMTPRLPPQAVPMHPMAAMACGSRLVNAPEEAYSLLSATLASHTVRTALHKARGSSTPSGVVPPIINTDSFGPCKVPTLDEALRSTCPPAMAGTRPILSTARPAGRLKSTRARLGTYVWPGCRARVKPSPRWFAMNNLDSCRSSLCPLRIIAVAVGCSTPSQFSVRRLDVEFLTEVMCARGSGPR